MLLNIQNHWNSRLVAKHTHVLTFMRPEHTFLFVLDHFRMHRN